MKIIIFKYDDGDDEIGGGGMLEYVDCFSTNEKFVYSWLLLCCEWFFFN